MIVGAPRINPADMVLAAVTPTTADALVPEQTGYFRNPLPMSDGTLIAVHTAATGGLTNLGSTAAGECARTHWNGPKAAKPRCRGSAAGMTCS